MCNTEPRFDIEERRAEIIRKMELIIMDLILSTVESLHLQNQVLKEEEKWAAEEIQF